MNFEIWCDPNAEGNDLFLKNKKSGRLYIVCDQNEWYNTTTIPKNAVKINDLPEDWCFEVAEKIIEAEKLEREETVRLKNMIRDNGYTIRSLAAEVNVSSDVVSRTVNQILPRKQNYRSPQVAAVVKKIRELEPWNKLNEPEEEKNGNQIFERGTGRRAQTRQRPQQLPGCPVAAQPGDMLRWNWFGYQLRPA